MRFHSILHGYGFKDSKKTAIPRQVTAGIYLTKISKKTTTRTLADDYSLPGSATSSDLTAQPAGNLRGYGLKKTPDTAHRSAARG